MTLEEVLNEARAYGVDEEHIARIVERVANEADISRPLEVCKGPRCGVATRRAYKKSFDVGFIRRADASPMRKAGSTEWIVWQAEPVGVSPTAAERLVRVV